MAERTVIWKAVADFSSIARSAALARRELDALERKSKDYGATSTTTAHQQTTANEKVAVSHTKAATATEVAQKKLAELSRARAEAVAATGRFTQSADRATESVKRHDEALRKTSTAHKTFHTDIDKSALLLSKLKSALAGLVAGAGVGSVLTRLGRSLTNLDAQARRSTSSWTILQSAVNNFKGDTVLRFVTRAGVGLAGIGTLAVAAADGIGALSAAVASLGVGLVSMVSSLGPVVGLLGSLPGLALAAAGAFGTTIGALSGVTGAMKAYEQQQKKNERGGNTAAKQAEENNKRIAQAETNMANARRSSARAIRDAERSIRDARENAARVQVDTARQIVSAEQSVVRAKASVVAAERNLVRAQEATNRAREEAVEQIEDLTRATKSYVLQEEGATLSLEESRQRLQEVLNDPGSTDLQRRQAALAVREAEARLEEVRHAAAENAEDLAEAQRKGIEGSDAVRSALEGEQAAHEAIVDAKDSVKAAEDDLARTREDAARSIRDANEAVVRSQENLEDAQISAAQATERAAEAMQEAATAAAEGAREADLFAEAMAKLTPEARAVVMQLIAMRQGWLEVRAAAERAVLPGMLVFLQSVEKLFPMITRYAGLAGAVMGRFFADVGRMMSAPAALDTWVVVLDDALEIMENWRKGLLNVGQVIANIAKAAAESGLNDWLGEITVGWTEAWKAWTSGEEGARRLNDFFQKTMDRAELLGSIVGGLVSAFVNVGRAGDDAGMQIWRSFDESLKKFNEWARSAEGFEAIKRVADTAVPVFRELGELVVAVGRGMGQLAVEGDPGSLIRLIRTELGPALMGIFRTLRDSGIMETFVETLASLATTLVDSGLLRLFADFANHIMELAQEALPALAPVIRILLGLLDGLVRGLTFVFREINRGSALGKWFLGFLVVLGNLLGGIAIAAFVIKIRNLFRSFRDGFRDVGDLVGKFADKVEALARRTEGAADRIRRALGGSAQPGRSSGFDAPGTTTAEPVRGVDATRAKAQAKRDGEEVGEEFTEGVEKGLRDGEREVHNAGEDVGEEVERGVKAEATPRKGDQVGEKFGEAVADGARDERRTVRRAGEDIGEELVDGAEQEVRRGRGRISGALRWGGMAILGAGAIGAGAATSIFADSLQANRQLQAEIGRTNQLFGESARAMEDWAGASAQSMFLTRTEALNTANNFGTLFRNMGYSTEESARLSQEMTLLAAGLVAANPGIDITDAYSALEDAFNGNYEAIGKLNPGLDESDVLQQALRDSGKSATTELTEQEKQAAFLKLAHEKAQDSTQILADKQETVAGKTENATNKWQTFKEKLGEKLETKLAPVVDELNKLLDNEQLMEDFAKTMEGLASAIGAVVQALSDYADFRRGEKGISVFGQVYTNVDQEKTKIQTNPEDLKRIKENKLPFESEMDAIEREARRRVRAQGGSTRAYDEAKFAERTRALEEERARKREEDILRDRGRNQQPAGAGRGAAPGSPAQVRQQGVDTGAAFPEGMQQGLEEKGPGFWTMIGNWIQRWVIDPVKEFLGIQSPSRVFAQFARDVVDGFIGGIVAKAEETKTKITTWFNDNIITPVKEFLGIQSPSRVFAGFAGEVIQGFFDGITAKAGAAIHFVRTWFNDNIVIPVKQFFGIESPSTLFFGFAEEVIQGFFNGITSRANAAIEFIRRWFTDNIVTPVKDFFGIHSPSTLFATFGSDVIQGFIDGVNRMAGAARNTISDLVVQLGNLWAGIQERFRGPTEFVVNTVYNRGIVPMWNAVAAIVGLGRLSEVSFTAAAVQSAARSAAAAGAGGYDTGGWTGPGAKNDPAGIVHADEFVVRKAARRKFERKNPGVLDHINRTGVLPRRGYRDGGLVTTAPVVPAGFRLVQPLTVMPVADSESFDPTGAAYAPGGRVRPVPQGHSGWNGGRYRSGGWHGGLDFGAPMGTPIRAFMDGTVTRVARLTTSYGQHVIIDHGGGVQTLYAHGSAIHVSPGQRIEAGHHIMNVGSSGNSTGPHLHFEVRVGGQQVNPESYLAGAALPSGPLSAIAGALAAPVSAFGQMGELITTPLASMRERFGDAPVVQALAAMPKLMADRAKSFLEEKLAAITDFLSMSGDTAGPDWQSNANLLMRAGRAMGLSRRAMHIALITAAQESSMGTNRTAMTRANSDGDVGWFQQRTTRGDGTVAQLADPAYALGVFIHGKRVPAGYHVPGLYNIRGWETMQMGDAAQRVQVSAYPRAYDKWIDDAERWLSAFGYAAGGWTGPGGKMRPAGIVHADEFVVRKESRRRFERQHPGALDHLNRTGKLPGYHEGGKVLRTGSEGGTWWRKGTYSMTGKWIGALRHFLGLDDWWKGWDDDLDNAIRNYDGRPATHVYLPQWNPAMEAMRRLPRSEFSSVQNVAGKIGVHPDMIFRMMDTNRADFNRDLRDAGKASDLEPSYARFRDFHKESVEELQKVLGVEVNGYWTPQMRTLLSHIRHHVDGSPHPDNLPTADEWSTVGAWGEAFDEVLRTNRLNAEWDRMMDQFYVWGYDSLIRHLEQLGVSQGMELARDLFNAPQNARDADAYYREFYEREDRIKDENSELNRLRRLVNYIRRYDNVGLQGLASELELTMDTTAMLFKKAQSQGMLAGVGQAKISRLEKDVIDFDKIFRFALGGLVPGAGNMDSVLALLTPGEYVLTRDQTQALMQFARYQAPMMAGNLGSLSAAAANAATTKIYNTTNNVTATIVSPNPRLAGVAFQKHMKKLSDNGLFGMEDDDE